jgi:hypothetical protein
MKDLVRLGRGGPVGALGDDLHRRRDPSHGLGVDLVLQGCRDEDLHLLLEPLISRQHLVTGSLGLDLVDPAETVRDAQELLEVDPVELTEGETLLLRLIPGGHASHRAAEPVIQLDGVLGDVPEALYRGPGILRPDPHLPEGLPDRIDHTVPGGFLPPQGAPHSHRFPRDEPGKLGAPDRLELVEHPEHVLG